MYHTQSNSFPMFFSVPNGHRGSSSNYEETGDQLYSFATSPSASVDCTLSLGTPSTRVTNDDSNNNHHHEKKRSSCMSNFGWNILPSKHTPPPKPHRGASTNANAATSGGDPLLARRCANCDTTSTPLWRNGPRGPKSLCNACGIRYKKEERRATAAAASSHGGGANMETQHMINAGAWGQAQKTPCYSSAYGNEYRFMEDEPAVDHRDSEIPYMSWRFNVTDRPSQLVHDFTR